LIAQMMKSLFPRRDLVFRYGGEEFVAVVPASTQAAASALFDGFRRAVEEHDFPQVGRVTASVGFVRIVGGRALAELVGQADHALYYAKHNGRNQVRSFDQLVAEGFLDSAVAEGDIELF
ncbi:MAG TPA: GGDEF domain-containing protein, partial [Azospirillaceae bacterium]|nr:GGDEF domain-containing protein [Azospirillaceae bacterium]